MEKRKFLVHAIQHQDGEEYNRIKEITLNPEEKANAETFRSKLDYVGYDGTKFTHTILSWSLIEE